MNKRYKSYKIFTQEEQAIETKAILEVDGIDCILKVTPPRFNAIFAVTSEYESELFVTDIDLQRAKLILEENAVKAMDTVPEGHYLYEFEDFELFEVIYQKDNWNELDVQIAQSILNNKGVNNFESLKKELFLQNPSKYVTPVTSRLKWIITGYICSIVFSFIGSCIGIHILSKKSKLPDGEIVYHFSTKDRFHGKIITAIGVFLFCMFVFSRIILGINFLKL